MGAALTGPELNTRLATRPKGAFPWGTLPELFRWVVSTYRRADALSYPHGAGWISYSHAELDRMVRHLALGLADLGVARGESVGLTAPSSPLWLVVDLAIQIAGGVTVPIFTKISAESFVHEVRDSGMRILFVGNPEEMPMAYEHAGGLAKLVSFWYSGPHRDFEGIMERGRAREQQDPGAFDRLCSAVSPDDLATIIYTSGSMGLPKGVQLAQANLVSQVKGASERFPLQPDGDVCLSSLPLAHVFERMVCYFYLARGLPVYFADDPKKLAEYARAVRPTTVTVVPRMLEKVAARITEAAAAARGARGVLARAALARAARRDVDAPVGPLDALYRRVVYPHMTAALGGRLRVIISGSSKLQPEVARVLTNIGFPIYEGYGLTEAAPVITANYPGRRKLGTVGVPFPGVEVRIAADGEILARGPGIMRGYHNNERATSEALTPDGWLHTGDLGSLDPGGFLRMEGRKKELFKKSTGEYVPPAPIEFALSQIPFVDSAVIVADGRPYVVALLFPDPGKLPAFKKTFGLETMGDAEFLASAFVKERTREYVERINAHLHHCERVERFAILDHPAAVESGELTQTLKPRRFVIEDKYRDLIDAMYGSIGGWK